MFMLRLSGSKIVHALLMALQETRQPGCEVTPEPAARLYQGNPARSFISEDAFEKPVKFSTDLDSYVDVFDLSSHIQDPAILWSLYALNWLLSDSESGVPS